MRLRLVSCYRSFFSNSLQVAFTMSLFPECASYTGVYDASGLLRANTILAHAVHLNDEEIALIAERKAGISHCPTSNFNLNSGVAPIGLYLDRGIKVSYLCYCYSQPGADKKRCVLRSGLVPMCLGVTRRRFSTLYRMLASRRRSLRCNIEERPLHRELSVTDSSRSRVCYISRPWVVLRFAV